MEGLSRLTLMFADGETEAQPCSLPLGNLCRHYFTILWVTLATASSQEPQQSRKGQH